MSKEKFKIRAAVLAKGTMSLRATLMIGDCFFEQMAHAMVTNSGYRGHPLTYGTAMQFLKENGFNFIQQAAFRGYNFDFKIGPVAVEINIGSRSAHGRVTDRKKIIDVTSACPMIYISAPRPEYIDRFVFEYNKLFSM
jgi:hypothetical protein